MSMRASGYGMRAESKLPKEKRAMLDSLKAL